MPPRSGLINRHHIYPVLQSLQDPLHTPYCIWSIQMAALGFKHQEDTVTKCPPTVYESLLAMLSLDLNEEEYVRLVMHWCRTDCACMAVEPQFGLAHVAMSTALRGCDRGTQWMVIPVQNVIHLLSEILAHGLTCVLIARSVGAESPWRAARRRIAGLAKGATPAAKLVKSFQQWLPLLGPSGLDVFGKLLVISGQDLVEQAWEDKAFIRAFFSAAQTALNDRSAHSESLDGTATDPLGHLLEGFIALSKFSFIFIPRSQLGQRIEPAFAPLAYGVTCQIAEALYASWDSADSPTEIAQTGGSMANMGFIGLLATELYNACLSGTVGLLSPIVERCGTPPAIEETLCRMKPSKRSSYRSLHLLVLYIRFANNYSCSQHPNQKREGYEDVIAKHCAGCGVTRYCSKDCQRAGWKAHKLICAPLKRLYQVYKAKNMNNLDTLGIDESGITLQDFLHAAEVSKEDATLIIREANRIVDNRIAEVGMWDGNQF